jgi:hypothetical protein
MVLRCKQHKGTFCDRYGTAFYDLKTPEEKVQRAIQQGFEGLCPEAENVELDELYSFVGEQHPDEQASDLEQVGGALDSGRNGARIPSDARSGRGPAHASVGDEIGRRRR